MGLSSDHICAPFRGDLNPKWELYKAANCGFRAERLLVRLMNRELGSYSWVAIGGTTTYTRWVAGIKFCLHFTANCQFAKQRGETINNDGEQTLKIKTITINLTNE